MIRYARYSVGVQRRTLYYSAVCYFLKPTQSSMYCLYKRSVFFVCLILIVFFSSSSSFLSSFIKTGYFEALLEVQKLIWSLCFLTIKPIECTNFSNLFWKETLHISDNSSVHHQHFSLYTAMVYVIQVCRQLASRSICSYSQVDFIIRNFSRCMVT